jgi:large subunit ribosomal protein L25
MSESKLQAEPRNEFGKGAARRIRRADKVPAVLYGHGSPPVHITLPGHDTMMALKHGGANALLTINVEGTEQLALPKQVQKHPVKGFLEHLDLLIVKRGEKVVVDVPVHVVGEPAPDTLVSTESNTVSLEAEATAIPEAVEVSVEGAEPGTQILVRDLTVPSGATLQDDPDTLVVNVTAAQTAEQLEAELAEAEAEAGIEHEAPAAAPEEPTAEPAGGEPDASE